MAVKKVTVIQRYQGASGDVKPTSPPAGSFFYETDTYDMYIYNGSAWVVYKGTGGII